MKNTLSIFFVLAFAVSAFGQRYSSLTSTNSVTATNLVAVEMFPNATNGTKSITISNLARSLGPYITNTVAASTTYNGEIAVTNSTRIGLVYDKSGDTNRLRSISAGANVVLTNEGTNIVIASTASGSGGNLVTNANQFGASTTLTIKSSPTLTNINSYGVLQALGQIDAEGGIAMGNLTPSRALMLNASGDITNSTVTDTELGYLSGATSAIQGQINARQGGSAVLSNLLSTLAVTNLGDVYVVATNGTRTSGFGLEPYGSISNAVWEAIHSTPRPITILILPGTHIVTAFTNSLVAGCINITNWAGDINVIGLGENTVIASPTREGTIFRVNDVGNVTFRNMTISGFRNTNITQVYGPGPGVGILFGGNCGNIMLQNVQFRNHQRFGSGVFHYTGDNIFTNMFYAHSCLGSNLGSWFTNGFNSYDGALFVLPNNAEIVNCTVQNSAQGFEIYGADLASSNAPNTRIRILNSKTRNIISHHIFVGGYTNNSEVTIRGCEFRDDPSWVRYDGSNYITGGTAFSLNVAGIQNFVFEDNHVETAYKSGLGWTSGAKNVYGGRIRRNRFFGGHTPIIIGNDGTGRGNYNFTVEDNDLIDFGGRGMQLIGVQDGIIRNNRGNNGSTNGSLAFIYIAGTGNAHASNILVEANSHIDATGSTAVTYGAEIAAGSTQIRIVNNSFDSVATGQISDAGTNTMIYSRTQSGVGIGTNTPAAPFHVHGRAYINGTNAARAFHFTGGQATNSLLYIDGGTNAGVVTIGANLTLTAGTLAASGGSASTNDTVEAIGSVISGFIDNTNQLYTRGLVIPPQRTGASVNTTNSHHWISTNAFTTFTFDGTVQFGSFLWLTVSNSSTTNITFAHPSAYSHALQSAVNTWTVNASNSATRLFVRSTNAAAVQWTIFSDYNLELGLVPGVNTSLSTNGNNVSVVSTFTVSTNSGTILTPTQMVFRSGITLSNDASGTASVHLALNDYDELFIGAAAMISNVTAGATFSTSEMGTPTNHIQDSYVFTDGTTNWVQFPVMMPTRWDAGTIKAKFLTWTTNNVATSTNVWEISGRAINSGNVATNTDWGTVQIVRQAVSSAGGQVLVSSATPALTVGNSPAAGSPVWFRIRRLGGHADDNTASAQAHLLGVQIQYRRSAGATASW